MYTVQMKINHEIATEMLTHNTNNYRKKIDKTKVQEYADDMANGRWENNGETIVFRKDGTLADGQHRLMAIVESGATVEMLVVYDVDNDIWFYDGGKNRTEKDHATAIGLEGLDGTVYGMSTRLLSTGLSVKRNISKTKKIEFVQHYEKQLREASQIISQGTYNLTKKRAIGVAVLLLFHYGYSIDTAKEFFKIVNSGQSESANQSAAIVFRNYLLMNRGKTSNNTDMDAKLSDFTIKAMRDFENGIARYRIYHSDGEFIALLNKWQLEEGIKI